MRYAILIHEKPEVVEGLSDAEIASGTAEYAAILEQPRVLGGSRLQGVETATTIRVDGEQTLVTDGPFADAKEVFLGFLLLEAGDLDEAIAFAARLPSARIGAAIEIRPLAAPPGR